MSLRVLDDERLGYAVLEFDKALDEPSLSISIRSATQHGAYLGPDGQWQHIPHYFPAQRIDGDAERTRYRVGPEIVNYMMEFDQVEVATADDSLHEKAKWENAVPEMSARSTHTIYRGPGRQRPVAARPPAAPPPGPPPASPPAPVEEAPPEPAQAEVPPAPPRPSRSIVPLLVGALALLLVLGAAAFFMRCQLFGVCPPQDDLARSLACAEQKLGAAPCDVQGCFATAELRARPEAKDIIAKADTACRDDQEAKKARACADTRHAAKQDCDVQSACVAPYAAAFPNGRARVELEKRARDAGALCAAARARDCIARPTGGQNCDVQARCVQPYLRDYPNGEARADLESRAAEATRACEEERALNNALSCAAITDPCKAQDICIQPYLSKYPNSRYLAQVQAEAQRALDRCKPPQAGAAMRDGDYKMIIHAQCGESAQFGQKFHVAGAAVSWQHDFRGATYTWTGTIDADGNIQATAPLSGARASGRYLEAGEKYVDLTYPQCGPVHAIIDGMR